MTTVARAVVALAWCTALLVLLLAPVDCLVDIVRTPSSTFRRVASNKALWSVLVIGLNVLGAMVYLAAVRPELVDASALP